MIARSSRGKNTFAVFVSLRALFIAVPKTSSTADSTKQRQEEEEGA